MTALLGLPAAVRSQIWTRYFLLSRVAFNARQWQALSNSIRRYATVNDDTKNIWQETNLVAPDEDLPKLVASVRHALHERNVSDPTKSGLLTALDDRVNSATKVASNTETVHGLRDRLKAALSNEDLVGAIKNAIEDIQVDKTGPSDQSSMPSLKSYSPGATRKYLKLDGFREWNDVLVASVSGAEDPLPLDLRYIQQNMQLPKTADLPNEWQQRALELHDYEHLILPNEQCLTVAQRRSRSRLLHAVYFKAAAELPNNIRQRLQSPAMESHSWVCIIKFLAPGLWRGIGKGIGASKASARAAAFAYLLSKLHSHGVYPRLWALTEPLSKESVIAKIGIKYPEGAALLRRESSIHRALNNAYQGRSGEAIDVHSETHALGNALHGFSLRVNFGDKSFETYSEQPGANKKPAQLQAWLQILSRLHDDGVLEQLFGNGSLTDTSTEEDPRGNGVDSSQVTEITQETMREEKDAKLDIYNFCAALGYVPSFEAQRVELRGRASRTKSTKKAKRTGVKVWLRLPELDISISTIGLDLSSAEIAAAIAFKNEAEKSRAEAADQATPASQNNSPLNLDNVQQFFDFLKSAKPGMNFRIENTLTRVAGIERNQARLLLDGMPMGDAVTFSTKKLAEKVARLVAAVRLTQQDPSLLQGFVASLQQGKGKVLREAAPVRIALDLSTIDKMGDAVVEVRRAGLSDIRESLAADQTSREDRRNRRRPVDDSIRQHGNVRLLKALLQYREDPDLEALRRNKASLPMSQYRDQVLELIHQGTYSIIIGATGSGKTTQVPQIILEEATELGKGGFCDVVCTQPRRLAASSVASRVAMERNERLGDSVGYHVRFGVKLPAPGGSITYCTTGILLEQLKHDADSVMDSVSHLVIDEVHERDLYIDFLLILLRKAVKRRLEAGKKIPKVILMSATLDPKLFSDYLAQEDATVPVLSVPGRTFPVQERYLGEIMSDLERTDSRELQRLLASDEPRSRLYLDSERAFSETLRGITRQKPLIDWKGEHKSSSQEDSQNTAREKEDALVPLGLVTATVAHTCKTTVDGAILVFLPGLQEITAIRDALLSLQPFGMDFGDSARFKICVLHSAVPAAEQSQVLASTPPGCRKIILSTNIAETSVTVPDVKYVVDTGKLRERRYDQLKRITQLQCTWESNSNARQRAGRAGRVQEGHYFALYSRERRKSMAASGLPELLRSDLQETCLSIKAQGFKEPVAEFLKEAIEPPSEVATRIAVQHLQAIEALTTDEQLTPLGKVLASLPVHPSLGKMVILGIIFRCLDPMIVLSATDGERTLFVNPVAGKENARAMHKKYAKDDSDHLALYEAYKDLRGMRGLASDKEVMAYAVPRYLHFGAFKTIDSIAEQIEGVLIESGLVPETVKWEDSRDQYGGLYLNQNSGNTALIKCLLVAGVHPNLSLQGPGRRTHRTPSEANVIMHPSSLNWQKSPEKAEVKQESLYAYSSLARSLDGKTLFLRDTTRVTPMMALLFGGKLETHDFSQLKMDDWLRFKVNGAQHDRAIRIILEFRKAFDRVLNASFSQLSDMHKYDTSLADDPINQRFVGSILDLLAGTKQQMDWIPQEWRDRRSRTL